jgi:hypothetical protein
MFRFSRRRDNSHLLQKTQHVRFNPFFSYFSALETADGTIELQAEELLRLLAILERTLELTPEAAGLLERIVSGPVLDAADLPTPAAGTMDPVVPAQAQDEGHTDRFGYQGKDATQTGFQGRQRPLCGTGRLRASLFRQAQGRINGLQSGQRAP